MPRIPIEPQPDTVNPKAPAELPRIDCPVENPGGCEPEITCPPDPSYTPDAAPTERPALDPDA